MHIIRARNVGEALPLGLRHLYEVGISAASRAGNVIASPYPVTTIYERPLERVLFYPGRDANPFFHFFEGLWMLAGRNDLAYLTQFLPRMKDFSNDGKTLAGAYGYRWRKHFGFDQIERVISLLRKQPGSRRAVITMWDPCVDLQEDESTTRDVCCNTHIVFRNILGRRDEPNLLNISVFNRSHDIIFGLYGANAVHFSMLQEYVAAQLGLLVGTMTTISNNFHAYEDVYNKTVVGIKNLEPEDLYGTTVFPYPMVTEPRTWDRELTLFMEDPTSNGFDNSFFACVAKPLWWAHISYRRKAFHNAIEILEQCAATDWRLASEEWIKRRWKAYDAKRGDLL